nr:unnamed protein product [Rangifer tarandus platyrhynchus]
MGLPKHSGPRTLQKEAAAFGGFTRQYVPRPGLPTRLREPVVLTQASSLATPWCLRTQPARASAEAGLSCPVLPKAGQRLR